MEVLFIWFGLREPLYDWRISCIKRAKAVYPDAKFKCITTWKEFYGMEVVPAYPLAEELNRHGFYADMHPDKYRQTSDEMRFWWLTHYPNTLYLDTDTWCESPIERSRKPGKMSIEALWSGEDAQPFKEILEIREKGEFFVRYNKDLRAEDLSEYFTHRKMAA